MDYNYKEFYNMGGDLKLRKESRIPDLLYTKQQILGVRRK